MVTEKHLIVGAFYWVIPKPDVGRDDDWDRCQEWQDEIQPARFNGWNAAGEMIWNFIGVDGSFRFGNGGVVERAMEVRKVGAGTVQVVSAAPAKF